MTHTSVDNTNGGSNAAFWVHKTHSSRQNPTATENVEPTDPKVATNPVDEHSEPGRDKDWTTSKPNGVFINEANAQEEWEGFESKRVACIEEKDKRIKELETLIQEKDRHIGELVAQMDEKDGRIQELEDKVDALKKDGGVDNAQNETIEGLSKDESQHNVETAKEGYVKVALGNVNVPENASQTATEVETAQEVTSNASTAAQSPKLRTTAWADMPNLPPLPKSANTISNDVKPTPKLSIPIKNGGKIDPSVATSNWAADQAKHVESWVAAPTAITKDIRDMTLSERAQIFRSPSITVMIGREQIRGISKHMFMAVSSKVRQYFTENPRETYIAFRDGEVSIPVMRVILDWVMNMGSCLNIYSLKIRFKPVEDLSIRRDCIYLGMEKYVAHFTKQYCDKIRQSYPGLQNIALIERNTSEDDGLWLCLCNNLAIWRVRGTIPEPEKFDKFLTKHPRLAQTIGRIETKMTANRNVPAPTPDVDDTRSQKDVPKKKNRKRKGKHTTLAKS